MSSEAPIGVFDSGLGGLTVVRELTQVLPHERIVYLGDTARVPYGTRSAETVVRYARGCAGLLMTRRVKVLVVACNTVSAVALDLLRAELDLPVVGVVEPGARAAIAVAQRSPCNRADPTKIGVLGTAGTIGSGAYARAAAAVSSRFEVVGQAAPLLVPLAEEGWLDGEVPRLAARRYLEPLIAARVAVVVLGCTHYPLLKPVISEVAAHLAGAPVPVVASARSTARAVATLVAERSLERQGPGGSVELLVTDRPASFETSAHRFLGGPVSAVTQVDLVPSSP